MDPEDYEPAVQESARFRILRTMGRKTSAEKRQSVTGTQKIRGSLYSGATRIPAIPNRKTASIINATAMHNPVESYQGTGAFLNMGPFSVCMISFLKGIFHKINKDLFSTDVLQVFRHKPFKMHRALFQTPLYLLPCPDAEFVFLCFVDTPPRI